MPDEWKANAVSVLISSVTPIISKLVVAPCLCHNKALVPGTEGLPSSSPKARVAR